jgi:DNA helicase-4
MLLLAFNKKAATEMRERLKSALPDDIPHVMTFHALAHAIVHPNEDLIYDDQSAEQFGASREVRQVIDEHIRSSTCGPLIQELMLEHFRQDWERIEEGRFTLPMDEFLAHWRSLPRETLNGESVKSLGERLIANVLFEHDIDYRYESNFRSSGINYRPDFMIGNRKHGGVIIEYFGLSGDPDYDEMSEEKRAFWAKHAKWKFIEYSPANIAGLGVARLAARVVNELRQQGIAARRLSEEEIWQRIRERAIDSFTKAMRQFVGQCRKLNLCENDLHNRITAHTCCGKPEELFLEIGQSVYAGYVRKLVESGKEDFDDLMCEYGERTHERLWRTGEATRKCGERKCCDITSAGK